MSSIVILKFLRGRRGLRNIRLQRERPPFSRRIRQVNQLNPSTLQGSNISIDLRYAHFSESGEPAITIHQHHVIPHYDRPSDTSKGFKDSSKFFSALRERSLKAVVSPLVCKAHDFRIQHDLSRLCNF